jgi:hypothetical protein
MGGFASFNVSGFKRLKFIGEGSKCTNIGVPVKIGEHALKVKDECLQLFTGNKFLCHFVATDIDFRMLTGIIGLLMGFDVDQQILRNARRKIRHFWDD